VVRFRIACIPESG